MIFFRLCLLSLCIISAATFCNESDPFNQKGPEQKEFNKSVHDDNPANAPQESGKSNYRIAGTILKSTNIIAAGAGIVAAYIFDEPMATPLFIMGSSLNGMSAGIEAKKDSKKNTALGIANLTWGICNGALSIALLATGEVSWPIYWGAKGAVNFANAAYRLYWARKQKS